MNGCLCSEEDLTLGVLFLSEDESFASLENVERFGLGLGALKLEHDLFCLLGLLPENGLCLPTESFLLHIISPLALGHDGVLAFLVLGHFMHGVSLLFPAVSSDCLWNMHHFL